MMGVVAVALTADLFFGFRVVGQASQQGPQKGVSAVRVVGPVGAASSVYEQNWKCKSCNAENYARRKRCVQQRGCRCCHPRLGLPQLCHLVTAAPDRLSPVALFWAAVHCRAIVNACDGVVCGACSFQDCSACRV